MSKWQVLVEETIFPSQLTQMITQMYPAEDAESARTLAEQVAFEYRPAMPKKIHGRSVFRTGPDLWTVVVRGDQGALRDAAIHFRVHVAEWVGDRES